MARLINSSGEPFWVIVLEPDCRWLWRRHAMEGGLLVLWMRVSKLQAFVPGAKVGTLGWLCVGS